MIRLARRTFLLVALHVLTSAATASAECAWVLWQKDVTIRAGDTRSDPNSWLLVGAFDKKSACDAQAKAALVDSAKLPVSSPKGNRELKGDRVIYDEGVPGVNHTISFQFAVSFGRTDWQFGAVY